MIWLWLIRNWQAVLIGAAVLAALAAAGWTIHTLREQGRAEVRTEINRTNQEATDAARRAREAHDLACARNELGCLSDPWTRDSGR